jgi:hypothetical protein
MRKTFFFNKNIVKVLPIYEIVHLVPLNYIF